MPQTRNDGKLAPAHEWLQIRWYPEQLRIKEQAMSERMNVESFNLDHTKVAAPFVRVADRKQLPLSLIHI